MASAASPPPLRKLIADVTLRRRHARVVRSHQQRAAHRPHVLHRRVLFRVRGRALALCRLGRQAAFAGISVSANPSSRFQPSPVYLQFDDRTTRVTPVRADTGS